MAGIGDFLKSDVAKGLAIGIGVAITVPIAIVAISGAGKPIIRALARSGRTLVEKGQETIAEVGEIIDDMIAEAKMEIKGSQNASLDDAPESVSNAERPEQE